MASPFKAFRKNQTILVAVLIGLSMFAFILAQSITAANFPIFLGMALGAVGLWLLSNKGGTEGWLIAAVGGIAGGLLGAFAPGWLGRDAVILTDVGSLTRTEVSQIVTRQNVANEFLGRSYSQIVQDTPQEERRSVRRPQFFNYVPVTNSATRQRNTVLTYLFREKANEMGVTISDQAVSQYLTNALGPGFSQKIFQEVRAGMGVGTSRLFDILREQLRIRTAYQVLSPGGVTGLGPSSPTPQQLWSDYKKLKVEAKAKVATVPVSAFRSQVGEPSTAELESLFAQYRTRLPQEGPGPGFAIPRRVQVAYLEILAEKVRKTVSEPTKEEVLAFYRANKARFDFARQQTPPGTSGPAPPGGAPVEAPRPQKATSTANDDSASPTGPDPASTENNKTAMPADSQGNNGNKSSPIVAPKPRPPGKSSTRLGTSSDLVYVSAPAESPQAPLSAPKTPTAPADSQEAAPAAPSLPPTPAPASSSEAGAPKPSEEDGKTGADSAPSEEMLARVRSELMAQRVRRALDRRQDEVHNTVDQVVDEVLSDLPTPPDPQQSEPAAVEEYESARTRAIKTLRKRLEELAETNDDLVFQVTEAMSFEELSTSDEYSVGRAIQRRSGTGPRGQSQTRSVARIVFEAPPDRPMVPIDARSPLNQSRYVALKIADLPRRTPEFTEAGIKEQVAEAWTTLRARELAQERAEKLAEAASESKKDLAAVLEGKTITGNESSETLQVESVGPFTWMSRPNVPNRGMMQRQMQPSALPKVPGAGREFMQTVFETTPVGRASAIAAADGESVYVVQVTSRTPEKELAQARDSFMQEDFFSSFRGVPLSPFRRQAASEARLTRQAWMQAFIDEHGVVFAGSAG